MTKRLLILGVALGLAYGLVEGLAVLVLSFIPGALSWRNANTASAIWFAPLLYGAVFSLLALVIAAIARLRRPWPWEAILTGMAGATGAYLLLRLPGVLWPIACLILAIAIGLHAGRLYHAHATRLQPVSVRLVPYALVTVLIALSTIEVGAKVREAWVISSLPEPAASRPNVLLLVIDTQRADHLSAYGYRRATSPFLTRLAAEGALFERAYSHSSWTLPSHASMFTGRALHEHRAGLMRVPYLGGQFPTIAEALTSAGYATGGFVANGFWCGRQTGLARGFTHYSDFYRSPGDAVVRTVLGRLLTYDVIPKLVAERDLPGRRNARDINDDVLAWIDRLDGRPFFAFVNYFDVHAPFIPPDEVAGRFGWHPLTRGDGEIYIGQLDKRGALPPIAEIERRIAGYDESMLFVDQQIEALYEALAERGMLENTMIIVTSDHGESWGEHDELVHGHSLWNNQIHVPLIVRFPERIPAGTRIAHPVGNSDLATTIAVAAGTAAAAFPGTSLIDQSNDSLVDTVIVEVGKRSITSPQWPVARGWVAGALADRWLFLQEESGRTELYDVVADPRETRNLTDRAALRPVRDRLQQRLTRLPLESLKPGAGPLSALVRQR